MVQIFIYIVNLKIRNLRKSNKIKREKSLRKINNGESLMGANNKLLEEILSKTILEVSKAEEFDKKIVEKLNKLANSGNFKNKNKIIQIISKPGGNID